MDRSRAATRRRYDEIAAHFAETRHHPWPEVTDFLGAAQAGEVGLDVGCANGRHLPALSQRVDRTVGVDLSTDLLAIARERGDVDAALVAGDATALPLAANAVALALYVATIHHLPSREARVRSLDELARVLAPDARALVSAWSTEHDRFADDPRAAGPAGFDATIDWTLPGGETVPRFYHVYAPEEFRADIEASALALREAEVSSGNCYATVGVVE